jgi:hypothetical protein
MFNGRLHVSWSNEPDYASKLKVAILNIYSIELYPLILLEYNVIMCVQITLNFKYPWPYNCRQLDPCSHKISVWILEYSHKVTINFVAGDAWLLDDSYKSENVEG